MGTTLAVKGQVTQAVRAVQEPAGGPACYDFCISWTDEDDAGFVELLDTACRARKLSLLQVTPANVERTCDDLQDGRVSFGGLFDRASDERREFLAVVDWARTHEVYRINPYELARRTWDKAGMHTALIDLVPVPYTLFIPAYAEAPETPDVDLSQLGPSFTIKPAHGGGGEGVVVVATSADQIPEARKELPKDMFMLQSRIVPAKVGDYAAWFRVIYAAGEIYPSWWDFDSRRYRQVSVAEEYHYGLARLRDLTQTIADVCQLDLFSTEIAIDVDGRFVVVDYVNDPIDLTLASRQPDGVSDELVRFIAEGLASLAAKNVRPCSQDR